MSMLSIKSSKSEAISEKSEHRLFFTEDKTGSRGDIHLTMTQPVSSDTTHSNDDTHLQVIFPLIPLHRRSNIHRITLHIVKPSKSLFITVQHNPIFSSFLNPNSIIRETIFWMEIEDKQQSGTFVYDHFVDLVFERNESLGRFEPFIFCCGLIHRAIEVVEVFVAKKVIIHDVPLTTCVVE